MTEPRFSEEEARELFRRAAELHAAEQARPAGRGRALTPAEPKALSFEDVAAAAEGAGIDPDLVRLVAAERRLPDGADIRRDSWTARWARRVVSDRDALDASRVVQAAPQRVLETLHDVAARDAFGMRLETRVGGDMLRDGVLVYRLDGGRAFQASAFSGALELADARVILATVRAHGDVARLRCRVPLFRRGLNLAISGIATGGAGAGGLYAGMSAGAGLAALLGTASAAVLLTPIGVGAIAGGALGLGGFRKLYDTLFRKADAALHSFLGTVAVEAETPTRTLPP